MTTGAAASLHPLAAPGSPALYVVGDGAAGRRGGTDRRARPTPMWSRHAIFGGRRRTVRRAEEREGSFVDVHGHRLFLLVSAIVALNLLDAWFTLLFLSHGGRELNPFVQVVLDLDGHPWPFLWFKTFGIGRENRQSCHEGTDKDFVSFTRFSFSLSARTSRKRR